jgi:hypothetical protein
VRYDRRTQRRLQFVVVTRLLTVLCFAATALAGGAARWSVDATSTPVQMWEWYWQQGSRLDRYVEGFATYDSFRRFATSVGVPRVAEPPR